MKPVTLTWSGFRGFADDTQLRLPRMTLLIGRNNVGKTSAYIPLLMLKQTLDARSTETALLSRGELVDAGPFRDYVTDHDVNRPVTFRVDLPTPGSPQGGSPESVARSMEITFRSVDGQNAYLSKHRVLDAKGSAIVSRSRDSPGAVFTLASPRLPGRGAVGRPPRELTALRLEMREEQPEGFLFEGYGGLIMPRSVREDRERWAKVQDWYNAAFSLFEVQQGVKSRVVSFLRGISYVGPLRSLPQRTYRLAAEAPPEVGGEGQYAPEVLFRRRDEETGQRVAHWLAELGYGSLHFEELNEEYFQLQVERDPGRRVNVADSGVGLSQVLPLLLQVSLADENSTVIAQQPEIHLNPAQQTKVTDVLIERALAGSRIVIESHSEHVLLRLRLRIAQGTLDAKDVAVYFVDNVNGRTHLVPIPLGENAELERKDWPEGFFEGQLDDSFALASAQAKNRSKRVRP